MISWLRRKAAADRNLTLAETIIAETKAFADGDADYVFQVFLGDQLRPLFKEADNVFGELSPSSPLSEATARMIVAIEEQACKRNAIIVLNAANRNKEQGLMHAAYGHRFLGGLFIVRGLLTAHRLERESRVGVPSREYTLLLNYSNLITTLFEDVPQFLLTEAASNVIEQTLG